MIMMIDTGCWKLEGRLSETIPSIVNFHSSFHEVSHERRRWPKKFTRLRRAASLIEKETFGARFRNWPLLGFAIRNNTGKM